MYSLGSAANQVFSTCSEDSLEKSLGLTRWGTTVGVAAWEKCDLQFVLWVEFLTLLWTISGRVDND